MMNPASSRQIGALLIVTATSLLTICQVSTVTLSPKIIHKQEMWVSGDQGQIHTYRTPIIITLPTGDVLAFSAPRKYTSSDKSAKQIVQRRSTDGGLKWAPTEVIEDDYEVVDGLNLGAVIMDYDTNATFILFGYCMHTVGPCTSPYRVKGIYVKVSLDWGHTWSSAVNVAEMNPALEGVPWAPGPGFGIQKEHAPNKGRLIACGHIISTSYRQMQCLYSDDHGKTWQLNTPLYGMPFNQQHMTGDFTPGETQIIELSNGTLLAGIRNENKFHCHCRLLALSFDGGQTFPVPYLSIKEELVDPAVFGSLALVDDVLFLSHTFNADSRVNLTLQWSTNSGLTWPHAMQLYAGPSEYSGLTRIDDNNLGVLFERDDYKAIEFYKIRLK